MKMQIAIRLISIQVLLAVRALAIGNLSDDAEELFPSSMPLGAEVVFTFTEPGLLKKLPPPMRVTFSNRTAMIATQNVVILYELVRRSPNEGVLVSWSRGNPNAKDEDLLTYTSPNGGIFENLKTSKAKGTFTYNLRAPRFVPPPEMQKIAAAGKAPWANPRGEAPAVAFTVPNSIVKKIVVMTAKASTGFQSYGKNRQLVILDGSHLEAYDFKGRRQNEDDSFTYTYKVTGPRTADFDLTIHSAGAQRDEITHRFNFQSADSGDFDGDATGTFKITEPNATQESNREPDPLAKPKTFAVYYKKGKGDYWYSALTRDVKELGDSSSRSYDRDLSSIAIGDTGVLFFGAAIDNADLHKQVRVRDDRYKEWVKAAFVLKSEVPALLDCFQSFLAGSTSRQRDLATFEFIKIEALNNGTANMLIITSRAPVPFTPSGFGLSTQTDGQMQFTESEVRTIVSLLAANNKN